MHLFDDPTKMPPQGIHNTGSESMASDDSTDGEDVTESLAREMQESLFDHRKEFWPCGSIDGIITRERVRETLKLGRSRASIETSQTSDEYLDTIAEVTSKKRKKIFATMLWSNLNEKQIRLAITQFQSLGFDDDSLPLVGDDVTRLCVSPAGKAYRKPWTAGLVGNFCSHQWKFLAPIFDNTHNEFSLNSNHILPFIWTSQRGGSGTFGEVHEVTIHPAHRKNVIRVRSSLSSQTPIP